MNGILESKMIKMKGSPILVGLWIRFYEYRTEELKQVLPTPLKLHGDVGIYATGRRKDYIAMY